MKLFFAVVVLVLFGLMFLKLAIWLKKLTPGEYGVRLLNDPTREEMVKFVIVSVGKETRRGKVDKKVKEKVYRYSLKRCVWLNPVSQVGRLLILTKDFSRANKLYFLRGKEQKEPF